MNPAWVRDLSPYHRQCIRDIGISVLCVQTGHAGS